MSNSQIYRGAAQIVRQRGWAWKAWQTEDGGVCLVQAVLYAMGGQTIGGELPLQMQLEIDSELSKLGSFCTDRKLRRERRLALVNGTNVQQFAIRWNDYKGRTAEEVAAVLDALANRLECEELMRVDMRSVPDTTWEELEDHLASVWDQEVSHEPSALALA